MGQTLQWNHAFDFVTDNASQTVVHLELRSRTVDSERYNVVGSYEFAAAELLQNPTGTAIKTVPLRDSQANLKLRFQLCFLGTAVATSTESDWNGTLNVSTA